MSLSLDSPTALSAGPGVASRRTLIAVSGLATLAGVAAMVADLALRYTSRQSALLSPAYLYYMGIPEWRLLLGHFLGIAAITLEIAGFWVVSPLASAGGAGGARSARVMLLIIAFGTVVGIVFHGSAALTALLAQARQAAPADAAPLFAATVARFDDFVRPLALVAVVSLAVWSIWYATIVARGRTPLPRWLALCDPLVIALVCRVVSTVFPVTGLVLAPTALNISTTATFLAITLALWLGLGGWTARAGARQASARPERA